MDFEFHFTEEMERFRGEVRTFIEENALKVRLTHGQMTMPTPELYLKGREMQRKLGAKGWFAPNYPKEYGGGGLDTEHCLVLIQEFSRAREQGRWITMPQVSPIQTSGVLAFGTEEQKRRFLTPLLRGEWEGWQCFTEPEAGSDEAALKSSAVRDGDVYIINGTKVFVGDAPDPVRPDYLYWLAVTNPDAPRHDNLSAFFVPADLAGIHFQPLDLITSVTGQKWEIVCEDVRCPADRRIGQEGKGWQVAQATLAVERGGAGSVAPRNTFILKIVDYCKNTMRNGQPLSQDPFIQDLLVELYIEYHVGRLWGLRNYAMGKGQIPRELYTITQGSLHEKRFIPHLGRRLLDILGPHSLLDDPELQILKGEVEYHVRNADCTHHGGTPEMQQIMMARALGLGRGAARTLGKPDTTF
ncbi:MAG: acyl-CoA dehydrogenase family protein [Chloroflexi bacterium]|nr:acyl-CoA dehydrogenase family protein [Chloroflexota bacterium]